MEKKQIINCTVSSCKYNDTQRQKCQLENIIVTPKRNVKTKLPNESMCSSYDYEKGKE